MSEQRDNPLDDLEELRSALERRDEVIREFERVLADTGGGAKSSPPVTALTSELAGVIAASTDEIVRRFESIQSSLYDLQTLVASRRAVEPPTGRAFESVEYADVVRRVREAGRARIPRDAVVAVVTGGDDALVDLYGRQAWHFPRSSDGFAAGSHPVSSIDAIAQLEGLRQQGATFLLFPKPAFWWFERYPEFRQHLDRRYPRVVADESCVLYSLGRIRAAVTAPPEPVPAAFDPDERQDGWVVSVILPVYNAIQPKVGDAWLRRTIESVLEQEAVAVELMIVDDGSVDDTARVISEYEIATIVNVLTLQQNRGCGSALNLGVEAASGSVIGRISAGDVFAPRKLRLQLEEMWAGGYDVVGSAVSGLDSAGEVSDSLWFPEAHDEIVRSLPDRCSIFPGSMIFKKKVWRLVGGYSVDPRYRFNEDYEFLVRVVRHPEGFRLHNLQEPLYGYRAHEARSSTSPITSQLFRDATETVRELARDHLPLTRP